MRTLRRTSLEVVAILVALVVFVVPFVFMFLTASKDEFESSDLTFSLPTTWPIIDNLKEVFTARDGMLVTAFKNSTILTVVSVAILVVLCSMVGFTGHGRRVGLVYLYKQGTFYAFAPTGPHQRDNLTEIAVRDQLAAELPMERDMQRWLALWNAPGL